MAAAAALPLTGGKLRAVLWYLYEIYVPRECPKLRHSCSEPVGTMAAAAALPLTGGKLHAVLWYLYDTYAPRECPKIRHSCSEPKLMGGCD